MPRWLFHKTWHDFSKVVFQKKTFARYPQPGLWLWDRIISDKEPLRVHFRRGRCHHVGTHKQSTHDGRNADGCGCERDSGCSHPRGPRLSDPQCSWIPDRWRWWCIQLEPHVRAPLPICSISDHCIVSPVERGVLVPVGRDLRSLISNRD
jgi:hypothetical protein